MVKHIEYQKEWVPRHLTIYFKDRVVEVFLHLLDVFEVKEVFYRPGTRDETLILYLYDSKTKDQSMYWR